jgi:hypothetical protein
MASAAAANSSLFGQIWAQDGQIVAVQPTRRLLPYFQAAPTEPRTPPGRGVVPKAGVTGLEPANDTPRIEIRL